MFLVDTNVLSEARKEHGHPGVKAWVRSVPGTDLFLSVLVVGEIRQGIERLRRRDAPGASVFDRWLSTLTSEYGDRLLPVSVAVAEEWGRLNAPEPLPAIDGLIAATARVHGLTVATRNASDFRRAGARVYDPFV